MAESPPDRCGFVFSEHKSHLDDQSLDNQSCCYRESWRDYERCIWHADVAEDVEKPMQEIQAQRETDANRKLNSSEVEREDASGDTVTETTPGELLDGINIKGIRSDEILDFVHCSLRTSSLSKVHVSSVDLANSNLSGSDLGDANLADTDLSEANLEGVNLTDTDLSGADLTDAHLLDADLTDARLLDANLTNADLTNADCGDANVTDADLIGADLTNACLGYVDLTDACLRDVDLTDADLSDADLTDADLSEADLTDASLQDAELTDARLSGADLTNADLSDAELTGASLPDYDGLAEVVLEGANLENQDLSGADLTGVELPRANLRAVNFESATLSEAKLREADLTDANLVDSIATDADFTEGSLEKADFERARIDTADFEDATLLNANLNHVTARDANFQEASLEGSDLKGSDLSGAIFERATLSNTDLFGADLRGAELYGVRLGGASVNIETKLVDDDGYCIYDPRSSHEYDSNDDNGERDVRQTRKGMGTYRALEQLARANAFPDKQSTFFIHRQDMRREQLRIQEQFPRLNYWFAELQNAVFRHGESFSRVVGWTLLTMAFFSVLYPLGGWIEKEASTGEVVQVYTYNAIIESPVLLWESFHHSAQLFLTGGGPLKPTNTVGEMLMFVESLIAPILLALIVFVLGRRAAR